MDLLGIARSVRVAFVTSAIYCFFLVRVVPERRLLARALRAASYLILTLLGIEMVLRVALGKLRTSTLVGRGVRQAAPDDLLSWTTRIGESISFEGAPGNPR